MPPQLPNKPLPLHRRLRRRRPPLAHKFPSLIQAQPHRPLLLEVHH